MLRLAVGRERQNHGLIPQFFGQADEVRDHLGVVVAGERILHHQHDIRFLLGGERLKLFQGHVCRAMPDKLALQRRHRQQRQIDHTDMLFGELAHQRLVDKEVKGLRRARHQRCVTFHGCHQMVSHRAQIARVVELQEARAEFRHIDLNRALRRAGFTGQTAGHRLFHLMGEIILALTGMPAIAGALNQRAQAGPFFRYLLLQPERINAAIGQQAQPFAHQGRPPFRRMDTVAGDFHRRTHRAFHIEVKAQTIAVTLQRAAPGGTYRNWDLPVVSPAFYGIHLAHWRIHAFRRADLSGIEAVMRVEGRFDLA